MPSLQSAVTTFLNIKPGHVSDMALSRDNVVGGDMVLGDVAGHAFHGNQYARAEEASRQARAATGMLPAQANSHLDAAKLLEDDATGVNGDDRKNNHADLAERHRQQANNLRKLGATPDLSDVQRTNVVKAMTAHQRAYNEHTKANRAARPTDPEEASNDANDATNRAYETNTAVDHKEAAAANKHAAETLQGYLDNDLPSAPKVPYPPSRFEDEGYEPLEKHLEHVRDVRASIEGHNEEAASHENIAAKLSEAEAASKAADGHDRADYEGAEKAHNTASDKWIAAHDALAAGGLKGRDLHQATLGPLMRHGEQAHHYHQMQKREKE